MDTDDLVAKGKAGEAALNDWLRTYGFSFVAVCQNPETFAPLFTGAVKRPDFLVLLESIGMIAVDVKNKTRTRDEYTLDLESELHRALAFERLFRLPLWYAYLDDRSESASCWYWISALRAAEAGKIRGASDANAGFLAIGRSNFERIVVGTDIAKLYNQRLAGTARLATLASGRLR